MSGKRIVAVGCIAILAIAQNLNVKAEVIVLREESAYVIYERKQLCASEEDGNAMIWNTNLVWQHQPYAYTDRKPNMNFYNHPAYKGGEVDCGLDSYKACMSAWEIHNWNLTDSTKNPMGPVFDTRWEDFKEYDNFNDGTVFRLMQTYPEAGSVPISLRGTDNAHILLCESEQYRSDFCYMIIIGGWDNSESVIRRCPFGVPLDSPSVNSECAKRRASYFHTALIPTEWRSFVLSWNKTERNITVYDEDRMILTFRDDEAMPQETSSTYHFFVRSLSPMLYKLHRYSFLYTTDPEASLKSPSFSIAMRNICMQMLIGLCAECEMDIALKAQSDTMDDISIMTAKGSSTSSVYGLPMWQNVIINRTLDINSTLEAKLVFTAILTSETERPFWAIANVRKCAPVGTVRLGIMTAAVDYSGSYFWPNVTCQKLSYSMDEVVSATPGTKLNVEFEGLNCSAGAIGPHCAIQCNDYFGRNAVNCRYTAICSKLGCTCPPGYLGSKCDTNCRAYSYGHDCKESCGQCSQDGCHFITGKCAGGCKNSDKYYIPPFCKTAIKTLPKPQIDFVNVTSVSVSLPAENEYKELPSSYTFSIKEGTGVADVMKERTIIYKNATLLVRTIDNLTPGTTYTIQCLLYIGDYIIPSEWATFTTVCSASSEFQIEPSDTGFTVKKKNEEAELYPCPASWYDISVREEKTGADIHRGCMTNFPFTYSDLDPYTLYKITISEENTVYYSQEVRTLEAAPTKVLAVRATVINARGTYLTWLQPRKLNGDLKKYEVTLEIQEYTGCRLLKRTSPQAENIVTATLATDMTFTDLHPFAKYVASVVACNSNCGPAESTSFTTPASAMPTAILSNLMHVDNMLSWGDPADCTMMTGPIGATRLIITGVSDVVADFEEVRQTQSKTFNLLTLRTPLIGAERYKVQIFAIRKFSDPHNETAAAELIFTSSPKAPPAVRNFERVEVDLVRYVVSLRWQQPSPPLQGEIDYYSIAFCNRQCQVLPIQILPSTSCELWTDYICATVTLPSRTFSTIAVYAYNKGVETPGLPKLIPDERFETTPEAPANLTIIPLDGGVLDVNWGHPWRTGGHLDRFVIEVQLIKSALRRQTRSVDDTMTFEHELANYSQEYSEVLYLHPSSSYNISIYGKTNRGLPGSRNMLAVETPPSIALNGELSFMVDDMDSMIRLRLPTVVNDTANSVMHIIVKGPAPCKQHTKLSKTLANRAGIKYYEQAWMAATISPSDFAYTEFVVGDNKIYGGATNCPLMPQDSYEVIVILQADERSISDHVIVVKTSSIPIGEMPRRRDEAWVVPIMILLIAAVIAVYFYRRRSKKLFANAPGFDEMPLSNNSDAFETKPIVPSTPKMLQEVPPDTVFDKEPILESSTPEIIPTTPVADNVTHERMPPIKVNDFEDYVRQGIATGLLDKQYETFPRGQTKPWSYGKLPQNKSKNRYANLLAYDETRVILEKLPNDPYSDYINANYIKGYKKEKRYIATQGPKQNTVTDFWRMIWQEEVLIICMLANVIEGGKTKCEQYWPDIGKKKKYGDVVVLNAKHNVFADYTFRTFHVTCGDITRKIEHLHYTAWPDHAVPLYTHSTVSYLKKLLATPSGNGPVVVHCSAGVGRTGTIILCDICLRRAAAEKVVDVFSETEAIRNQRANMVDNKQQYLLAHLALVECLLSLPTALPCNDIMPAKIKELKKQLPLQRQRLENTAWQDEALRPPTVQTSLSEKNKAKNRYPELLSEKVSRVYIKRYPVTDEDSDYVSGVFVDGVKMQNQYLAAQLPLPSTFNDFWRMVAELKVELIVMLQPPDLEDPTCCALAPSKGEFKPTPYINIIAKDSMENEHYTSQKLSLIDNSEKPATEQRVTILSSTDWRSGRNAEPPPVISLVTLWQAAERVSRGEGPVVTLCHDGVTGCGLYLALSFLLERMAVERECDVCLAIRAIRRSRTDFVQSLEHMEYLYDAALTYMEYFETYANFN